MERLRQDDPPQIGPYVTLARVDADGDRQPVPDRRYIARSSDGERTVVVCLPRVDADPMRWAVEAEGARRSSLPGLAPVTEVGGSAAFPWHAMPYVPTLPLPAALALHAGPLPETVVRSLGAALATTLATAHEQGVTHAGLSPTAVLLGAEGPLLASFGAVRAAAPDGEQRTGLPGLEPSCLAPEQAQGGRPRPLGDVYALGAVLSYASTGHTVPEREELPASLRSLITACLSRDAAKRPPAAQLAAELAAEQAVPTPMAVPAPPMASSAPPMAVPTPPGQPATVLDTPPTPSPSPSPLLALPPSLVVALARQSADLLATQLPQQPTEVS
ncbi:serine/threonine protein kinase [Streptomyces sp. NBC_01304]|uniref:serine/threonine protein kinase n=1 Tax=Streptomyces sp. NBC_01304 TaxID=2903818 RepID=UPI002E154566|nr:serine/threonine protein kinase [Streptomyces sp. NBC_01304]